MLFGDASTLREKGAKESFKVYVNSRDIIENIPVDDQEVPEPRDSSISMNLTSLAPYNRVFLTRTIDTSS